MPRRVKVFFDGGYRPATGMETAVVVRGKEYVRQGLGPGNSLEAEWLALTHALEVARELGLTDTVFLGDSLAVIGQVGRAIADPCAGLPRRQAVAAPGHAPGSLRFRHVRRSQNLAGIALARLHER